MTSITQLPAELLVLIITFLDREVLKELRLTDHAFSDAALIRLFEELHISSNSYSFDRAHSIAAQAHLNKHVRSLVYHFGTLGDYYAGFEAFKRDYFAARRIGPVHDPYEITSEVLWAYNCWLEEIDGQRTYELRDESEELSDLCSRLPRLESIATRLDEAIFYGDHEDYIGKRTGMAATNDNGQWHAQWRFPNLFAAALNKPLRKISARSIQWHDLKFLGCEHNPLLIAAQQCLNNLNYFELGLYRESNDTGHEYSDDDDNDDPEIPPSSSYLQPHLLLASILKHTTTNLHTLRLDFDELPYTSDADSFLQISQAILSKSNHWPKLIELKLEAICTYDDELIDFLYAHRLTLRRLYIGDIELVTRAEEEIYHDNENNEVITSPAAPSVLQFFTKLHGFLHLDSCRITGNFTNRVDQAWYVDTEVESVECIRDQFQRYICGSGSGGRNSDEEDNVTEDGSHRTQYIAPDIIIEAWIALFQIQPEEYEGLQDESWQWASELLPEDA